VLAAVAVGALVLTAAVVAAPLVVPRAVEPLPPDQAAVQPAERVFQPGHWHDLLDRPPTEWHWFNPVGNSHHTHDPKLHRLYVQSAATALLGLGRADSPGFVLQLGMRQQPWTGIVGVFFAGRKDAATGLLRFQYIELFKAPAEGTLVLRRGRGSIQPRAGQVPLVTRVGAESWPVPQPLGPREYVLEIAVTRGGLGRVAWDGTVCGPLLDRFGRAAPGTAYQGEFGLYCEKCSVQLIEAKFLPTE
jgi:hypothetical protein